jgi:hypothetical protein
VRRVLAEIESGRSAASLQTRRIAAGLCQAAWDRRGDVQDGVHADSRPGRLSVAVQGHG